MKLIIDAHSWIEYLNGGAAGEKLSKMLKGDNDIYVLPITIAEVVGKVKGANGNVETAYSAIIKNAKIQESTPKMAKDAGLLYVEIRKKIPNFGLVDSIIISTAKITGAKVVTGDPHFKQFKEAIIL